MLLHGIIQVASCSHEGGDPITEIIQPAPERTFLVGVDLHSNREMLPAEASLEELALLADTAGMHVVGQTTQRLRVPNSRTYVGSGKVEEIKMWAEELDAQVLLFDDELSPRHQRELDRVFGDDIRVLDRTALILDIFAQHARTREGTLQVSLAQYEYRLPRLTRQWTHLARQAGGGSARGGSGGVGLRGPGETQLETDRREIGRIISQLKVELEDVRAHRERHRQQRRKSAIPVVALVGYTNAGKSSMLNRLSGARVLTADQLFATLDPTTRRVDLPDGQSVLFSDTVGFIQKLPTDLIAAFRATLEEVREADIVMHVVDGTHPHCEAHIRTVNRILQDDIQLDPQTRIILVINKIDALEGDEDLTRFDRLARDVFYTSAHTGQGINDLLSHVMEMLHLRFTPVDLHIPFADGAVRAGLFETGHVDAEEVRDNGYWISARILKTELGRYSDYLVDDSE